MLRSYAALLREHLIGDYGDILERAALEVPDGGDANPEAVHGLEAQAALGRWVPLGAIRTGADLHERHAVTVAHDVLRLAGAGGDDLAAVAVGIVASQLDPRAACGREIALSVREHDPVDLHGLAAPAHMGGLVAVRERRLKACPLLRSHHRSTCA